MNGEGLMFSLKVSRNESAVELVGSPVAHWRRKYKTAVKAGPETKGVLEQHWREAD